jgi:hypothetical protein
MNPRRMWQALMLIVLVSACDGGSSTRDGSVTDGDTIVCPTSDSGRFSETPSGVCKGVGSCAFEIEQVCRPGAPYVASTPPVFVCECHSQQWQPCTVRSGGFGLIPCEDAGVPE